MADDDQTEAIALLFAQSSAEITQQNSSLDALRTRSVALLSVGTLAGGLFGSHLTHGHLSSLNTGGLIAALALFAASTGVAITVAWPRKWIVGTNRQPLVTQVADGTISLAEVNYALASRTEQNWAANQKTLANLYRLFAILCALTGAQVIAWAIAVI
jgi:hypothetical protein